MPFYVYMLLCEDGSYYTGYTKDVPSRVSQHRKGRGARYTRSHKPKRLVYTEACESLQEARKRERMIKRLSHNEKRQLTQPNSGE
jgi:putative endonuclease